MVNKWEEMTIAEKDGYIETAPSKLYQGFNLTPDQLSDKKRKFKKQHDAVVALRRKLRTLYMKVCREC